MLVQHSHALYLDCKCFCPGVNKLWFGSSDWPWCPHMYVVGQSLNPGTLSCFFYSTILLWSAKQDKKPYKQCSTNFLGSYTYTGAPINRSFNTEIRYLFYKWELLYTYIQNLLYSSNIQIVLLYK